jgi:pimeloyl-ACP methyl ester carboxylesterase
VKRILAAIVAALMLSACAAAPQPARQYADAWYAPTGASIIKAINLHETDEGWRGSVWLGPGNVFAIRNIVQSGDQLSFQVPAMVATFSGQKDGQGWSGDWTPQGTSSRITFQSIAPPAAAAGFFVLDGGRRIYMDCKGTGLPAVIFESGAGSGHQSWTKVQREIAKTNLACTYDRAGFGASDPGPFPRDAAAAARDMDALLTAAKISAPYILVGHSLGGIHVRQYANTHFDKVAGIVLVDPSGDNQRALWRAAIPKHSSDPRWTFNEENWRRCMTVLRGALLPRSDPALKDCTGNDADTVDATLSSLHAMEHASAAQLAASRRSYGDLPLIVLSAGIDGGKNLPPEFDDGERAAFDNVWADLHRDQASLSTIGERRIVPGAGHGIQTDAPQAVIDAIREVLAAASTR